MGYDMFLATDTVGTGLFPGERTPEVWNRSGATLVKGDLLTFDIHSTVAAETTNYTPGDDASGWNHVRWPVAAQIAGTALSIMCVVVDLLSGAGANDTKVKVAIMGPQDVLAIRTVGAASVALGSQLVAALASGEGVLDASVATGEPIFAFANVTATYPAAGAKSLQKVWLNGFRGLIASAA